MDPEPSLIELKEQKSLDDYFLRFDNYHPNLYNSKDNAGWHKPSILLIGLSVSITSLGVPLIAVLTDRPSQVNQAVVSNVVKNDGSKPSVPISFSRIGESGSRNSSWK